MRPVKFLDRRPLTMESTEKAKKFEKRGYLTVSKAIADNRKMMLAAKGRIGIAPEIDFNVGFNFRVKFRIGGSIDGEASRKKNDKSKPSESPTSTTAETPRAEITAKEEQRVAEVSPIQVLPAVA